MVSALNGVNYLPFNCSPATIVKYIRFLYDNGAEYTTVNLHRSAIAKVHQGFAGQSIGVHPLVNQAVKSVFRQRPPLPKYISTFDISPVLDYMTRLSPTQSLDLKQLTLKTLILTIYSSLSRVSSLARLGPLVTEHRDHVTLHLHSLEKQGRPGRVRGYIAVQRFEDPTLCPASAILAYRDKVNTYVTCFSLYNYCFYAGC